MDIFYKSFILPFENNLPYIQNCIITKYKETIDKDSKYKMLNLIFNVIIIFQCYLHPSQ